MKPHVPVHVAILSAVVYGSTAVACNFSNKSAMLIMPFAPNTVLLVQLVTMFCTAAACSAGKVVSFPAFSTQRFWQLLPLGLAFAAHASLVLRSLLYLNIAIYNTLKRLTPVLVLAFKAVIDRKWPSLPYTLCVTLIVLGCIVAGKGDLAYSFTGYLTAFICAVLQAVYILLAEANDHRKHSHPLGRQKGEPMSTGQAQSPDVDVGGSAAGSLAPHHAGAGAAPLSGASSSFEALFYISLVGMPLLLLAALVTGEWQHMPGMAAHLLRHFDQSFAVALSWTVAVALSETALTGTLIWCTESNSGLTTSVVGVLKGVVSVVLGFMFMAGPARPTWLNLIGVTMVMIGGCWYSSLQCAKHRAEK